MSAGDILGRVARRYRSLAPANASVLAAVSGGADSTALLCMLHALKERCAIRRLGVLHVNHGLRGRASDGDEAFVASLARRMRLPLYLKKLSGTTLHAAGTEAWARRERYGFFDAVRERERYDAVATGHTADDQAETVLFRLMRGTGLRGLRGILADRGDGVIRPMIDCRRKEILAWLRSRRLRFRHDASNDDRAFRRNQIRHEVLPLIERSEPDARKLLVRIAEKAGGMWSAMRPAVDKWISGYAKKHPGWFTVAKKGLADGVIASEGLRALFELYAIPTDSSHVDEVIKNRARSRGEYLLPGGAWRYYPLRKTIAFRTSSAPPAGPFSYALTVPGITECPGGGARFIADEKHARPEKIPGDNLTVVLDREACGRKLVYRSWRSGDRFVPLGSDRQTGVGSFLAKQRLSKVERTGLGVVEGRDGAVIWIPGVRISNLVRVTPATRRFLMIVYQSCPAEE
jgi:tRNA(Ile)-lysidine synthase